MSTLKEYADAIRGAPSIYPEAQAAPDYEQMKTPPPEILRPTRHTLPFADRHDALKDYSSLARRMTRNIPNEVYMAPTDQQYYDQVIHTMDALKDLIGWVKAQTEVINMTYKTDDIRREMHLALVREGFRALAGFARDS